MKEQASNLAKFDLGHNRSYLQRLSVELVAKADEFSSRPVWTFADAIEVINAVCALGFSIQEISVYGRIKGLGLVEAREYPYGKNISQKSVQVPWSSYVEASKVEAIDYLKTFNFHEKDSTLCHAEPGFSFTAQDENSYKSRLKKSKECECAKLPKSFSITSVEKLKEIREILRPYLEMLHFEGLFSMGDFDGVEIRPVDPSYYHWLEENGVNLPDVVDLIMTCKRCAAQYHLNGDFYHGPGGEFRQVRIPLRKPMTL